MKPSSQDTTDVSPPIARPCSSPAKTYRRLAPGSARSVIRPSTISFVSTAGRESIETSRVSGAARPRPLTASSRPGSSHRRLTMATTTQWRFLDNQASGSVEEAPELLAKRPVRLHTRPATARNASSTTDPSKLPVRPRRPATCRGRRTSSTTEQTTIPSISVPSMLLDPRIIHEAARHEQEQEIYVDPLIGKSVEPVPKEPLHSAQATRDPIVTNAISRSELHRLKAFQARGKGDYCAAIAHYERLLDLAPSERMACFQLAVAYEKVGRFQEALHTYREILKTDTNNAFLHFNLGNLLMKLDHVDDATVAYTMAIEKSGGASKCLHQAFYRQRGAAYRKKGDFEKAAQDYSRVQAAQRRLSTMSEIEVADMKDPQQEQFAVEDKQYTSERIFTSRLRRLTVDTEDLAPLEASNHQRVMTLACHQPDERTEHDLDFLTDELRSQFSILSVFHTEAVRELCRKLGGFRSVLPGTLVSAEGDEGGFIFLVGRGRLATYKKITHLFAPTQQSQPEDEKNEELASETTKSSIEMVSMEQLLTTAADEQTRCLDEETGSLWSVVAQSATSIASHASWYQDQRMLTELARGDTCGRQGRFSQESRSYSVVAAEECDLLVVSWVTFAEAERTHRLLNNLQLSRFMSTIPLFHNIPTNELTHLARLGRDVKVIGSRVICSEDQYVNGLIIVREGELCQLHPSDLARPPNLLVGFNLSGSISVNRDSPEQSGLHFFTQLEFADDSLFFAHDSAMMHGFLPQDFVSNTLKTVRNALDERSERSDNPASSIEATSIQRGGFFSASSSWIPPRESRETAIISAGVTCAKNTLISISSASLLFFTPADLIEALSPSSRSLLQKNMTEITTPHATLSRSDPIALATKRAEPHSHRMLLKPPSGRDLVRRYEHDIHWQRYKSEIVKVVIEDKERRKANFVFNQRNSVQRPTR